MGKKVTTVKVKRVPDGALHAASRDIRTVLRWSASAKYARYLKTDAAHYGSDKHISYGLTLEAEDGEVEIRATTIAKCFQHAAYLIRCGELSDLCGGDEVAIEGRDF